MTRPNDQRSRQQNVKDLRILTVNINGCRKKELDIAHLLLEHSPDVLIGNETKLDDTIPTSNMFTDHYNVYRKDRKIGGGGVMIAIKNSIPSAVLNDLDVPCEMLWAELHLVGNKTVNIGTLYRPPNSDGQVLDMLSESLNMCREKYPRRNIILSGDMNLGGINWPTSSVIPGSANVNHCRRLIDVTDDCGLQQMVSEPTHDNSLLDLFFTNIPGLVERCRVGPGISDHSIIITDMLLQAKMTKSLPRKIFLYKHANTAKMSQDLSIAEKAFFQRGPMDKSVEENWSFFKESIVKTLEDNTPSKVIYSNKNLPWINRSVTHVIRRRNRAHKKAKNTNRKRDWIRFRNLRKETHHILKKEYWKYVNKILEPCLDGNTKPFWRFIKSRRQDQSGVSTLKAHGTVATDSLSKAEMLNHQFRSVFTQEVLTDMPTMGPSPYAPMPQVVVSRQGVLSCLQKLDPNKASGPDGIPARLLKMSAENVVGMLTFIFQQSISLGSLPQDWKTANVAPLFKKGSRSKPENYRPVSLTSICSKILEHILASSMWSHLDEHHIISDSQHGFRRNRSCESQLTLVSHDTCEALNHSGQVDAAVLDFAKAFDKVPHRRLISKLEFYGINGVTLTWIERFLTGRTQRVVVSGIPSEIGTVDSGVPQGTVLGPLLFLLFINDITVNLSSTIRLFADDCLLYKEIKIARDTLELQQDLDTVCHWSKTWQMEFNVTKCTAITFKNQNKRKWISHHYTMHGKQIDRSNTTAYLGVQLDSNMSWTTQVNTVASKGQKLVGMMWRNLNQCHQRLKEKAYIAIIRPCLEYASQIWDPWQKFNIRRIEAVQRSAARMVMGIRHRWQIPDSVTDMITQLKWTSLEERRKIKSVTFLYRILNGHIIIPQIYHPSRIDHNYSTTTNANPNALQRLQSRIQTYKNSFFTRTIPMYNTLPVDVTSSQNLDCFKSNLALAVVQW